MADILRDDLVRRLHQLAVQEQRSIDEIVENLLDRYSAEDFSEEDDVPSARLLASAMNMPPFGKPENISEHADEILRNEFLP